ncbi:MAG TPA: tyrosinase family protein [Candidatus Angelobacter sp.]|jgi:tyrosinase
MAKYIRANAWNKGGTFDNTDLLWYAKGVGKLQERALDDKFSWWFFAAIHGIDVAGWGRIIAPPKVPNQPLPPPQVSKLYWNQCQHQSWFFPPWHRGYLLALEASIRAAVIELKGPSTWALPYWNYFGGGSESKIPPAFTQKALPDGTPNPLYVAARYGSGADLNRINQKCLSNNVYQGNTSQTPPPGFGGPITGFWHGGGTSGNLEANPHNLVHTEVGGGGGLMSYPDFAALDPIFYLHHANIDRMWAGWNQKYPNPKSDAWVKGPTATGDRKFVMPMPDRSWDYTPGDVDSLSKLDYTYDNLPTPPIVNLLAQRLTRLGAVAAASKVTEGAPVISGENVELVGTNQQPLPIKGSGVSTTVRLDPGVRRKVTASLARASETAVPDRVFLNLENVRGAEDATTLDVYINLPEGAKPSDHPELFAGSVSLFGLRRASAKDEKHGGAGLNLVLDITDVVDALHLKNGLDADSLNVRIAPAHEVRDEDQITVGRVSIYRHGQ